MPRRNQPGSNRRWRGLTVAAAMMPAVTAPFADFWLRLQTAFLSFDPQFRPALSSHALLPSCSCASPRSRCSARGRISTSKLAPILGAKKRGD